MWLYDSFICKLSHIKRICKIFVVLAYHLNINIFSLYTNTNFNKNFKKEKLIGYPNGFIGRRKHIDASWLKRITVGFWTASLKRTLRNDRGPSLTCCKSAVAIFFLYSFLLLAAFLIFFIGFAQPTAWCLV